MLKKGTKLYSIFKNKCPRCQQGDFFINADSFKFKNNLKLHDKCSNCQLKYMIEPSFFYGAMYVSYSLTVAMSVAIFLICHLLSFDLITTVISIIAILILSFLILVRISRLIYINMFISYEKIFDS